MSLMPEMETDLMQNYSESYEEFFPMDYTCDIKTCVQEVNCGIKCRNCEAAIQVKVATPQERFTFRKAVVVVVAMERMQCGGLGLYLFSDSKFSKKALVEDDVPAFEGTMMAESVYKHLNSSICQITDTDHKCLLLNESPGQDQLVARHLEGANTGHRVTLKIATYRAPPADTTKRPVTLAIEGQHFYLSCLMVDGRPELRLEIVNESMLSTINSELLRFLFFKVDPNSDKSTFESAACPGWFISTSQEENEVVTVTTAKNPTTIQTFRLSPR